jgi:hypothetical protein
VANSENNPVHIGEQVQVEWRGCWYPAEVVSISKDGTVRIHYIGWDDSYDEAVLPHRIARGQAAVAFAREAAQAPPGPVGFGPLEGLLLGNAVTEKTRLSTGDKVIVDWNGSWWKGEILAVNQDHSVRVHYTGWGSEFDETVPRSRLETPGGEGRKLITIHFDQKWTMNGSLLRVLPDGYLVSRAEDHKVCLVHREKVVFVEINW